MHNFVTVLKFEITRTLKKPTFWIAILAIPVLLGIVVTAIYFSNQTTQKEQTKTDSEPFSLIFKDDSGIINQVAISQLGVKRTDNKQAAIEMVKQGKVDAFFYYPTLLSSKPIEIYNKNDGLMDNSKYVSVANNLLQASAANSVSSPELLAAITGRTTTTQTNFDNGESVNPIGKVIIPAVFLVIFYAIIVLLGNQMLTSTTEEKENRITEMLLTSITSKALIIGKIMSLVVLGFVQILVILIPVIVAYMTAREALNIPDISNVIGSIKIEIWPITLGLALLISGFLLFTGLLVGIGAAMPTAKEASSFFGIVITTLIAPFWFFSLLTIESDAPIVDMLSYFPLTAPFTLLIRNAFGVLPLSEALIGLTIVSVSGAVAIYAAIRIFRYGTLEYSNRLSLKSVFGKNKSVNRIKQP